MQRGRGPFWLAHCPSSVRVRQTCVRIQATHWLVQQSNKSSEAEPADKSVSKMATKLAQHFAKLPQDVSHSQSSCCIGE